ncbi:MAG: hypothetical protein AB7V25_16855 [Mangrovibacterium sp.]
MNKINTEKKITIMVIVTILLLGIGFAHANVYTGVGKALGRIVLKVESRELAALASHSEGAATRLIQSLGEEGAEAFLKTLSPAAKDLMVRNGERGAEFFMKTGPAAESLAMKYGDDILRVFESVGGNTAEWAARYGDEGVRAANRFGVAATEELVEKAGIESLTIANRMGHPAMAILKRNPEATPLFQAAAREGSEKTLVNAIERGGDRFFQFAQRNWKGMSVATLCAAFLTQPEKFTAPAGEMGQKVVESGADVVKELIRSILKIPSDAISNPKSLGGALLTFSIIFGLGGLWMILRHFRVKSRINAGANPGTKAPMAKSSPFVKLQSILSSQKEV